MEDALFELAKSPYSFWVGWLFGLLMVAWVLKVWYPSEVARSTAVLAAEREERRADAETFKTALESALATFTAVNQAQRLDLTASCALCRETLAESMQRMTVAIDVQSKLIQEHSRLLWVHIGSTSQTVQELNRILEAAGERPVEISGNLKVKHGE